MSRKNQRKNRVVRAAVQVDANNVPVRQKYSTDPHEDRSVVVMVPAGVKAIGSIVPLNEEEEELMREAGEIQAGGAEE